MKIDYLFCGLLTLFLLTLMVADSVITDLSAQLKTKAEMIESYKHGEVISNENISQCVRELKACGCG